MSAWRRIAIDSEGSSATMAPGCASYFQLALAFVGQCLHVLRRGVMAMHSAHGVAAPAHLVFRESSHAPRSHAARRSLPLPRLFGSTPLTVVWCTSVARRPRMLGVSACGGVGSVNKIFEHMPGAEE